MAASKPKGSYYSLSEGSIRHSQTNTAVFQILCLSDVMYFFEYVYVSVSCVFEGQHKPCIPHAVYIYPLVERPGAGI